MCWFPWHCFLAPLLSVGVVGYVGSTKQASQEFHLVDVSIWHVICKLQFFNSRSVTYIALLLAWALTVHRISSCRTHCFFTSSKLEK
jgi:hypothetical protein